MASEAERLIGISLTKIAQSRSYRGGVSLHKNLLVATVLQKARYIFMEEAYNMVHFQAPSQDLVGLTAEEAGLNDVPEEVQVQGCAKCAENQDKENHPPETTYVDLDRASRERSKSPCLKRRRAVTEWETEEAVQSILPKRSRQEDDGDDDSVFLDDAALLSDAVSKEVDAQDGQSAMEIDRITSLVSIFSFSMGDGKLNRSMSTPDLCSAQAKECPDGLQQRQFIAMTV